MATFNLLLPKCVYNRSKFRFLSFPDNQHKFKNIRKVNKNRPFFLKHQLKKNFIKNSSFLFLSCFFLPQIFVCIFTDVRKSFHGVSQKNFITISITIWGRNKHSINDLFNFKTNPTKKRMSPNFGVFLLFGENRRKNNKNVRDVVITLVGLLSAVSSKPAVGKTRKRKKKNCL